MIIFFIHRFNDVDHMTPIIYKLAKDTKEDLLIMSLNPLLDISNDFRLLFLKEKYNVSINYLYNSFAPSRLHKFFGSLVCSTYSGGSFKKNIVKILSSFKRRSREQTGFFEGIFDLFSGLFRSFMMRFNLLNKIIRRVFNKKWVEKMLKSLNPSALVFDYAAWVGIYNVAYLISIAKTLNIPTIDVPSGIAVYLEHPPDYKTGFLNFIKNDKDYMIVDHNWYRDECIKNGVNPTKIKVLGSARYCKEWEDLLHEIIPVDHSLDKKGEGKLNVVFMERGADRYHELTNLAKSSVDKLSQLEFIHLIIKPPTRSNRVLFDMPSSVEISYNVNSVNLIKWADVVIVLQSAIIVEVLLQDKVFLYPRFLHKDRMIFEEFGACWAADSFEELEESLRTLNKNRAYKPYTNDNVREFLKEAAFDGVYGQDILGNIKDFILDVSKKDRVKY